MRAHTNKRLGLKPSLGKIQNNCLIYPILLYIDPFFLNLLFSFQMSGDLSLARRCLRLCLSSDSSHGSALNNLAVIAAQYGQYHKTKTYLMAAKVVLPTSEEIEANIILVSKFAWNGFACNADFKTTDLLQKMQQAESYKLFRVQNKPRAKSGWEIKSTEPERNINQCWYDASNFLSFCLFTESFLQM